MKQVEPVIQVSGPLRSLHSSLYGSGSGTNSLEKTTAADKKKADATAEAEFVNSDDDKPELIARESSESFLIDEALLAKLRAAGLVFKDGGIHVHLHTHQHDHKHAHTHQHAYHVAAKKERIKGLKPLEIPPVAPPAAQAGATLPPGLVSYATSKVTSKTRC